MRVFISYSHDSPEHSRRVLDLCARLRQDGIDCWIDQFEVSPPEGWPQWMDRQVEQADFVLVVATETYLKRCTGQELPGKGLGVRWESLLVFQDLYDAGARNTKFVPVVFREEDARHVPKPLRGATRVSLAQAEGYQQLLRRLYNLPPAEAPPLGQPLPRIEPAEHFFQLPPNNLAAAGAGRSLDFVGRRKELRRLYRRLAAGDVAINHAVAGEGGVGKTQLAVELVHRHAGDFDGLWWLDASEAAIDLDTWRLADAMGLNPSPQTPAEDLRRAVLAFLASGRHLLVLDNLERPERLRQLCVSGRSRVLVTTRRTDLPTDLVQVESLDVFELNDAVALLRLGRPRPASHEYREDLDRLAQHLGCHALAVALAAGYLRRYPNVTPRQLLGLLKKAEVGQPEHVLEGLDPRSLAANYRLGVAACLGLHLPKLADVPAGKILGLAAFCHPKGIPIELFVDALKPAGLTPQQVWEELARLRDWSILKYRQDVDLHPLTQSLVRCRLGAEGRRAALVRLVELLCQVFEGALDDYKRWPIQDLYARHAAEAVEHAERLGDIALAGTLANQAGVYFWNRAQLDAALAILRTAERLDRAAFGNDHPKVATYVSNVGGVLHEKGDLEGALACFREAERIDRAALGNDHPSVAICVNNVGNVLQAQGDLKGALACLREAERIDRAALGNDHPSVATTVNNVGMVLKYQGDLEGALGCFRDAERIGRAAFGNDHPKVAMFVNNLGLVLQDQGDLEGAMARFREAERIDRAAFGNDHPNVARDVNNVATVLFARGDREGAARCCRASFDIWIRRLGPRALYTLLSARNLLSVGQDPIALARQSAGEEAARALAAALADDS